MSFTKSYKTFHGSQHDHILHFCSPTKKTSHTSRHYVIVQNFKTLYLCEKKVTKLCTRSFLHEINKNMQKKQLAKCLYIRGDAVVYVEFKSL